MTHDHDHTDSHAPIEVDVSDGPDYFEVMVHALQELLVDKGLIDAGEVRARLEVIDSVEPSRGAALIARAWTDPAFKQRLLADGSAAIHEFGIDNYDGTHLIVIEQTSEVHNLVVCTLCSCYPRPVLGLPPDWYKSRAYRARAVRDPRGLLREFGTDIPPEVAIRVHDSNANMRYLIMPM
jgi:nitrile hydratase